MIGVIESVMRKRITLIVQVLLGHIYWLKKHSTQKHFEDAFSFSCYTTFWSGIGSKVWLVFQPCGALSDLSDTTGPGRLSRS